MRLSIATNECSQSCWKHPSSRQGLPDSICRQPRMWSLRRVDAGVPPLVASLVEWCQRRLSAPGKEREMAALLLGRLLPRPDMPAALEAFLDWAGSELGASPKDDAAFLIPGAALACRTHLSQPACRCSMLPGMCMAWCPCCCMRAETPALLNWRGLAMAICELHSNSLLAYGQKLAPAVSVLLPRA